MLSSVRTSGCPSRRPVTSENAEQLQALQRERRSVRREAFYTWWAWNEAQARDPSAGKRVRVLTGFHRGAEGVVLARAGGVLHLVVVGEDECCLCSMVSQVLVVGWEQHRLSARIGVRVATLVAEKRVLRRPEVGDSPSRTRSIEDNLITKTASKKTRGRTGRGPAGGQRHKLAMSEARMSPTLLKPLATYRYKPTSLLPFEFGGTLV